MIDPLTQSVLISLVAPIYESAIGPGKNVFSWFNRKIQYERNLEISVHEYEERYKTRHGKLKLLGMTEPRDIESVFTNIKLGRSKSRQFKSIQTLEESHRQGRRRKFDTVNPPEKEAFDIVNQEKFLMILGGPGAGKSTFLRRIGLEALKPKHGKLDNPCIPVFIELKQFTENNINLENKISEEFEICGFPEAERFTSNALSQGKLLILLDALDEVPTSNLYDVLVHIKNFVDKYNNNRFIASCRSAAYYNSYLNFSDFSMTEFDDSQIEFFLHKWFQEECDKTDKIAQKCWEILQKPENSGAKELAHTPLLLTLLCFVYAGSQNLPKNRASLYDEALDLLMNKWLVEKRVQRNPIYQDLNPPIEKAMLSEIAYKGFEEDRFFFSEREVVDRITAFLRENLNAPKHLDGEKILNSIEIQQGILVKRAHNIHSFSHSSFQEYLTAQYIDDHRQIKNIVSKHLTDSRWGDVFLLVAGLMRAGADELLLSMEKESQNFMANPKLFSLLNWADRATVEWHQSFNPIAKRAVALGIVCSLIYAHKHRFEPLHEISIGLKSCGRLTSRLDRELYHKFIRIWQVICTGANIRAFKNYRKRIRFLDAKFKEIQGFQNINFSILKANLENLKPRVEVSHEASPAYNELAISVWQNWLKAFDIDIESIDLSPAEIQLFNQYLATNLLMLKCQKASVRVSHYTWRTIETRMLRAN
ncbi:NACHT domain-containing protein [Leptothoe spongobia]|uniref:NACHT domain-containing protein n=1 Tax=Leptothoe spongobia TAU-MAC 1115 TaxID=1967444 RepID=A0A947DHW6_9CYAN|nr:NACHT domain-containing protein [Leptothoe spongobia]MBT9317266.1 NACHT domain-containing protein [Leptothoe spongobia TAU-MAC 1115]